MAGIQEYLDLIKNAVYGKDVRQAIHDGIQQCYLDGKAGAVDLEARQRIDEFTHLAEGSTTGDAELADGRVLDGSTYTNIGGAIRAVNKKMSEEVYTHTFNGKENFDIDYPVKAGKPFYIKADVDNVGWIYLYGAPNTTLQVRSYYRKFTPTINQTKIRFYSGTGSGYTGTINFTILSEEEYILMDKTLQSARTVIVSASDLSHLTGGTKSLNDFPPNKIVAVGASNLGLVDYPVGLETVARTSQGVCITFDGQGNTKDGNGLTQIWITTSGMATRWKTGGSWTRWVTGNIAYKQYDTRAAWLAAFPNDLLGEIPVNKLVCIGAGTINAIDTPRTGFVGNVITLAAKNYLDPGSTQLAFDQNTNVIYSRQRYYSAGGNYWGAWTKVGGEEEYHVGSGQTYTSFTSCLLDLKGNNRKKVIYIHEGEYDMFEEYLAEVTAGRITIPADDITSPDYFEPYNAFVPNNTRIVGLGNVILKMTPTVAQLESMSGESDKSGYGASRTWSPLNIYGSVEIENITVKGHNCRYCLHNDDHNNYPNSRQYYKNVRFLYEKSDRDSQERLLGFNNTIGFGIQNNSTHIFEDCEMYMDTDGNDSAYYGHEGGSNKNGKLILRNCRIHSNNFSNNRVVRFQSLATAQGKVNALFESCYINGGIELNMYYSNSPQNFDVDLVNTNKLPIRRTIASGGTIVDPYTVKWYNPLPTPTTQEPLIETDSYNS